MRKSKPAKPTAPRKSAPARKPAAPRAPRPPKPKSPAKIMIVDDHPSVRRGLADFIADAPGMEVCGEAAGIAEAMQLLGRQRPDAIVIDLNLSDGNGLELIKQVRALDQTIRMLVFSFHEETMYARRALRAGALGYITKGEVTDKVIEALRRILSGDIYLTDAMSARLLSGMAAGARPGDGSPLDELSDREFEVFELIGRAQGTPQIAKRLHLSVKTIESHRTGIKRKLNLRSNLELIHSAMHHVFEQNTPAQDRGGGEG